MSQGVPEFGVWNDPNAEKFGFTNTFEVVRKVRHDRSSMDHIPIQQTIDTNPYQRKGPVTNSGFNERMRNERLLVRYDKGEIWETESAKSTENSAPQTRQSWRPPAPNERRRHDFTPAKHHKVLISRDDPRGWHERPITGPSPGTTRNAIFNSSLETQHRRRPSASSDGSSRDLLSSREEEYMAKEIKPTYYKPKGPTAPQFGKWNVDPNCTQEYTKEFAIVRHKKENSVVEPENNPTPQSYYVEKPQQKINKGTKTSCLDCFFPRVKTF